MTTANSLMLFKILYYLIRILSLVIELNKTLLCPYQLPWQHKCRLAPCIDLFLCWVRTCKHFELFIMYQCRLNKRQGLYLKVIRIHEDIFSFTERKWTHVTVIIVMVTVNNALGSHPEKHC